MPNKTEITGWNLQHTYQNLHPMMFSKVSPQHAEAPKLRLFNETLAAELGLDVPEQSAQSLAELFSGNALPEQASPIAQAYAGHQFGQFTMLGDGRALLWGEQTLTDGSLKDMQFKGSGRTPYSRGGDGRATLYSMLREYLISEAMNALGIPSSRSLAVVETGEQVYRTRMNKGAVLTRVSDSHIRVGTFEYARRFLPPEALTSLLEYTINRHYPDLAESENPAVALLERVLQKQAELIAQWMSCGFIHGVMNTDNMTLSAETIDYGPCAFMNAFNPKKAFSSIDAGRRYSWGNQPGIAQWNLSVLAGALLPLIHEDQDEAVKIAKAVLESFEDRFQSAWYGLLSKKLGFAGDVTEYDRSLADDLLRLMQQQEADFTNTFLFLETESAWLEGIPSGSAFDALHQKIRERQEQNPGGRDEAIRLMAAQNPFIIPRNHQVERALTEAAFKDDYSFFNKLLHELQEPYRRTSEADHNLRKELTMPPEGGDGDYRTFCGT
ncbi:Uncharacterized conserved protein YdiU, UPF0061 family [Cyclonatronum proteinivorum]|uniref:Protein nucleotidyltransferase YdiU n=1 Tax=Cyclonatronum proteinivorum TaxID=1457365 RepID=A0A345UL55_9BACT|nr:YdiU family protein [Cyclonatronum proteinivorum]AXJ01207.1 Uncharacterized conserved protein YdiU, UPF0061 family [Cyclonatronum proteinivorum]